VRRFAVIQEMYRPTRRRTAGISTRRCGEADASHPGTSRAAFLRCETVADAMAVQAHHWSCVAGGGESTPPSANRSDRSSNFFRQRPEAFWPQRLSETHPRRPRLRGTAPSAAARTSNRRAGNASNVIVVKRQRVRCGRGWHGPGNVASGRGHTQHSPTPSNTPRHWRSDTKIRHAHNAAAGPDRSFRQIGRGSPRRRGGFILWWSAIFTQGTRGRGNELSGKNEQRNLQVQLYAFYFFLI
jgi:hypothetical protein